MSEQDTIISKVAAMTFIDNELELRFEGKRQVTEPDNAIQAYCFSMINLMTEKEMGKINIKAGYTENIVNYRGNVGFTVYDEFRGSHYSARSCILLIPVVETIKMTTIWITCNLENIASLKNIEKIGAVYINTVEIPPEYYSYYPPDARIKRRYKWEPIKA